MPARAGSRIPPPVIVHQNEYDIPNIQRSNQSILTPPKLSQGEAPQKCGKGVAGNYSPGPTPLEALTLIFIHSKACRERHIKCTTSNPNPSAVMNFPMRWLMERDAEPYQA